MAKLFSGSEDYPDYIYSGIEYKFNNQYLKIENLEDPINFINNQIKFLKAQDDDYADLIDILNQVKIYYKEKNKLKEMIKNQVKENKIRVRYIETI